MGEYDSSYPNRNVRTARKTQTRNAPKVLKRPIMSQKRIYKDQLSFQVKTKKTLIHTFLKMAQDQLQNTIQLHSKATQLTKMAKKLPSTRNNIEKMITQKPL